MPVYYLASSVVVVGVEGRPSFGVYIEVCIDLKCGKRSRFDGQKLGFNGQKTGLSRSGKDGCK